MAKTKKPSDPSRFGAMFLIRIALVLFFCACAAAFIITQISIVEKKRELAALQDSVDTLTAQNEELQDLIESDDMGRYMEKLAVENNDYAYPDERRYYDTSHN